MKQFIDKFFLFTAKKILLSSLAILTSNMVQSQDTIEYRFDFSVAAGLGYNMLRLGPEFPNIITAFEVSLLYQIRGNRYIGFTYSKLNYTQTRNFTRAFSQGDFMIHFEDYRDLRTYQYFGIEFRQEVVPRLHLGVGLSYIVHNRNRIDPEMRDGIPGVVFSGAKMQRLDDLALSASMDYYFPVRSYFHIGLRTKGFLSLNGFEAITLTPVLRFSF